MNQENRLLSSKKKTSEKGNESEKGRCPAPSPAAALPPLFLFLFSPQLYEENNSSSRQVQQRQPLLNQLAGRTQPSTAHQPTTLHTQGLPRCHPSTRSSLCPFQSVHRFSPSHRRTAAPAAAPIATSTFPPFHPPPTPLGRQVLAGRQR